MKKIIIAAFSVFSIGIISCSNDESVQCSTPATVRDYTGTDGCGFVFELEDGSILEPNFPILFCGTPPIPKEVTEHPLYDFEWANGKEVFISYKTVPEAASVCMLGEVVEITCITEAGIISEE